MWALSERLLEEGLEADAGLDNFGVYDDRKADPKASRARDNESDDFENVFLFLVVLSSNDLAAGVRDDDARNALADMLLVDDKDFLLVVVDDNFGVFARFARLANSFSAFLAAFSRSFSADKTKVLPLVARVLVSFSCCCPDNIIGVLSTVPQVVIGDVLPPLAPPPPGTTKGVIAT